MPVASWRSLLLSSALIAATATNLTAAPLPERASRSYRKISFAEFRRLVSEGNEVTGRLVPSQYIVCVIENAENLLKQSRSASLKLKSSRVTGGTVRIQNPTRDLTQYPAEVRRHFNEEENKRVVYIALPIEISDTDFDAKLYLNDVVIEHRITLDNVDFRQSVYFQGGVFQQDANMQRVHFHGITDFSRVLPLTALSFRNCEFDFQANFAHITIPGKAALFLGGESISAPLDFSGSEVAGALTLQGMERTLQIQGAVYLSGINNHKKRDPEARAVLVGNLHFKDIVFQDNVYMDQSNWAMLDLAESMDGLHRPIRFRGFCDLRQGLFDIVDLGGAEFERGADLTDSHIQTAISFERSRFREPVRIVWKELRKKLRAIQSAEKAGTGQGEKYLSVASYEELERNFEKLGDLDSQNACHFERRWLHDGVNAELLFAGYWVCIGFPMTWMAIGFVVFLRLNKTGFRKGWFERGKPSTSWTEIIPEPWRLTFCVTYRWMSLPEEYSGTARGKLCYLLESFLMKLLLLVLLLTLKNTSPLLRELLPYFLPK